MSALPLPLPEPERTPIAPRTPSPDYLPARIVNEFVYCPRLFFYEWVEGVFLESADTLEGSAQHKRVDARPSELPEAGQSEEMNSGRPCKLRWRIRPLSRSLCVNIRVAQKRVMHGHPVPIQQHVVNIDSEIREGGCVLFKMRAEAVAA